MTRPATPLHRRSTALLALVLPLTVLVASAAVAWSWEESLPDPVVTHWGTDGADRFGSLASAIIPPLVIGSAFSIVLCWFSGRAGSVASTRRFANGLSSWFAVFLSAISLGTLHVQRGLTDAADVGGIGGVITLALGVATAVAVLVALVTPAGDASPTNEPVPADATRLPLGEGERAVWFQRPRGGAGIAIGALAAVGTGAVAVSTEQWWMLLVTVGLLALVAAMFSWVVRVDEAGLTVRSALGFPRTRIPLDELVQARATTVRCFREFGGWGWRTAIDGRTGIVLRSGDTLEVTRSGGAVFVVTVDDAGTGAALLNTLADRVRPAHRVE